MTFLVDLTDNIPTYDFTYSTNTIFYKGQCIHTYVHVLEQVLSKIAFCSLEIIEKMESITKAGEIERNGQHCSLK